MHCKMSLYTIKLITRSRGDPKVKLKNLLLFTKVKLMHHKRILILLEVITTTGTA